MTAPTDRDLLVHTRRGDSDAFGEPVTRHQSSLFNVCYRILHERGEAEDKVVTTNYRGVLFGVLLKRLNDPAMNDIFSDYSPVMRNVLR